MRNPYSIFIAAVLFIFNCCQPVETIELDSNIIDDPDFNLIRCDSFRYESSGMVNIRNFYVHFTVKADSLNTHQLQKITGYRLFEHGEATGTIMGKDQRFFYRSGQPVGKSFTWQIAPVTDVGDGKLSKAFVYVIQ